MCFLKSFAECRIRYYIFFALAVDIGAVNFPISWLFSFGFTSRLCDRMAILAQFQQLIHRIQHFIQMSIGGEWLQ